MNLIGCISINHKRAGVELREKICIEPEHMTPILNKDSEAYTLNTCNRAEIYFRGISPDTVYGLISKRSGIPEETLPEISDHYEGIEAVRHLFKVSSGLDSLVIGESQILGQVKDAYRECLATGITGTLLNKALHRAFRTAKRIRTETDIGKYPVSIASEAVELACHIFGDISTSRVLVIGAGDMASIAAKRLMDRGAKKMSIINRTQRAACDLARELNGVPLPFESLQPELASCDIVISSTGAPTPIITRAMIETVMKKRKNKEIFIIDIAVPRDVEPDAGKCYNCYLYDIDSLKSIVDRHFTQRREQTSEALSIIEIELESFNKWIDALNANTTISDLFSLLDTYVQEQLDAADLDEKELSIIEKALRTSLRRFVHRPVSFLKDHPGIDHIEHTRRLFQLDEDYQDRHKR
ncbi:MAG TPA: glutamyl-tRNA reductase [Deltaproteobacteria bacterium]|nr:glutamyl-tRNA reductase [Deltaproteobacteria bacterium]